MTKFTHIKMLVFLAGMALLATACSTSSDDGNTATVKGSVEQQQAKAADSDAYVVSAARVTSNGSLEMIEGTETEVNASGNFTLTVDAEAANHIAVVARKGERELRGYLSSNIKNGKSYTLKALSMESTAETNVFAELVASGNAGMVQKADVEAVVGSRAAAEIAASASAAAKVAASLKNAAKARAEFYANYAEDNAEEALEATFEKMAKAQLKLEAELRANASAEARQEAYEVFTRAMADAYMEAEMEASSAAKAIEMWGRVVVNGMTTVSDEVRNDARLFTSAITAIAIDLAVQAEAEASGVSEASVQAIADAGMELRTAIEATAGVRKDIEAAFERYHEEVRTALESDSSVDASIIVAIDTEINAANGAKATFSSAVATVVSASVIYDIYQNFFASIQNTVQNKISAGDDSMVKSVSEIMILINLSS